MLKRLFSSRNHLRIYIYVGLEPLICCIKTREGPQVIFCWNFFTFRTCNSCHKYAFHSLFTTKTILDPEQDLRDYLGRNLHLFTDDLELAHQRSFTLEIFDNGDEQ